MTLGKATRVPVKHASRFSHLNNLFVFKLIVWPGEEKKLARSFFFKMTIPRFPVSGNVNPF